MILADTSMWIDHFRRGHPYLRKALEQGEVLMHPFIVGELACGNLSKRAQILDLLQQLPRALQATQEEVLAFIEANGLIGEGLGFVDAHLLASSALSPDAPLVSRDRRLMVVAARLGLAGRTGIGR